MNSKPVGSLRRKIHEVIYEADTKSGKVFDIILLFFIILSVFLVIIESLDGVSSRYINFLNYSEWIITVLFTIEYILRIVSVKKPFRYIFSFYGVID